MNIFFAASEVVPYCKTGGLADVVGALSTALSKRNHRVAVALPAYKEIDFHQFKTRPIHFAREHKVNSALSFFFIENQKLFNRKGLYGYAKGPEYNDNHERFSFFSLACLYLMKKINFKPDVIHCHDWHTGLIPAHLKTTLSNDPFFKKAVSIMTVHNLAYEGRFPKQSLFTTHLPLTGDVLRSISRGKSVSFLKAGLVYADGISTVSPTYKKEISTKKEFGYGFQPLFKKRARVFKGILNGLDDHYWNPQTDPFIKKRYHWSRLQHRDGCKADLQKQLKLTVRPDIPVLGFVGRLETQKGIDVLLRLMRFFRGQPWQFVCLGQGQKTYVQKLKILRKKHPKKIRVETSFAEPLAHKIYAGADLFLMPSEYEPCGLGQLISLRYGAIPVVMPTGGLVDTITNDVGFQASRRSYQSYLDSLTSAIHLLGNKKAKERLQINGMKKDYSWKVPTKKYISFYKEIRHKQHA